MALTQWDGVRTLVAPTDHVRMAAQQVAVPEDVCGCLFVSNQSCVCAHACACVYVCACVCACMCVSVCVCVCLCVHV